MGCARFGWVGCLIILGVACDDAEPRGAPAASDVSVSADGGGPDAAPPDVGRRDARVRDATPDAHPVDASPEPGCREAAACPQPDGPLCAATCTAGVCGVACVECSDAIPCPGGDRCAEGVCVDPCGECPADTECVDGACQPIDPRPRCGEDRRCPGTLLCDVEIGRCVPPPDCDCPITFAQVCGADGNIWPGRCEAECAGVEVAYPWQCTPCDRDVECQFGFECIEGECRRCDCGDEFELVCGLNGMVYGSRCDARCNHVEVAHVGLCVAGCPEDADPRVRFLHRDPEVCETLSVLCPGAGVPFNLACGCGCIDPSPICEADDACPPGLACRAGTCRRQDCDCPAVEEPVCGADGETYANPCLAACADMRVARPGPCPLACAADADCAPGRRCEAGACVPCGCLQGGEPQCGTDRASYANACVASCAQAEIAHPGACPERCHDDIQCGVGNRCEQSYCEVCECAPERDPVCGSDGGSHLNVCWARCAHVELVREVACDAPCDEGDRCPIGWLCVDGHCTN